MALTFDSIQTINLGGSSSVAFTSIPQTFTDLRVYIHSDNAAGVITIRPNNSSTAQYTYFSLSANNSVTTFSSAGGTNNYIPNSKASSGSSWIHGYIDIFDYASSNYKNIFSWIGTQIAGNSTTGNESRRSYGRWGNTTNISSLQVSTSSGSFGTGSYASLYGILKA